MFDLNVEDFYDVMEADGWEVLCPCRIEDVQAVEERFPPWVHIFCQFFPKPGIVTIWTKE